MLLEQSDIEGNIYIIDLNGILMSDISVKSNRREGKAIAIIEDFY